MSKEAKKLKKDLRAYADLSEDLNNAIQVRALGTRVID